MSGSRKGYVNISVLDGEGRESHSSRRRRGKENKALLAGTEGYEKGFKKNKLQA